MEAENQAEDTAAPTSRERAARMLRDAAALRADDPSLFLRTVTELTRQAREMASAALGDDHPLIARLRGTTPDPAASQALMDAVEEYREAVDREADARGEAFATVKSPRPPAVTPR